MSTGSNFEKLTRKKLILLTNMLQMFFFFFLDNGLQYGTRHSRDGRKTKIMSY